MHTEPISVSVCFRGIEVPYIGRVGHDTMVLHVKWFEYEQDGRRLLAELSMGISRESTIGLIRGGS